MWKELELLSQMRAGVRYLWNGLEAENLHDPTVRIRKWCSMSKRSGESCRLQSQLR